jgi:hypothetical protein
VWSLTPRQAFGYLELAARLERRGQADALWVAYTGAQVDQLNVNQLLTELRE